MDNQVAGVDSVAVKEEDEDSGYISEASTVGMPNSEDQSGVLVSQSVAVKEEDDDGYVSVASTVGMAHSEDESEEVSS